MSYIFLSDCLICFVLIDVYGFPDKGQAIKNPWCVLPVTGSLGEGRILDPAEGGFPYPSVGST